jgi:hypothetical protein
MVWTLMWIGWGVLGLTLEIATLLRPKYGDTLSENIWVLLKKHPLVWFIGLGLSAWALLHLFGPTWTLP